MNRFINSMIGKEVYPMDNSQQYNIATGEKSHLAGTSYGLTPQKVTIVSEPYKLSYHFSTKEYSSTFVTVLHNGELYTCLNHFYDNEEEAMQAHERYLQAQNEYLND